MNFDEGKEKTYVIDAPDFIGEPLTIPVKVWETVTWRQYIGRKMVDTWETCIRDHICAEIGKTDYHREVKR